MNAQRVANPDDKRFLDQWRGELFDRQKPHALGTFGVWRGRRIRLGPAQQPASGPVQSQSDGHQHGKTMLNRSKPSMFQLGNDQHWVALIST
jgi:hypothetical protein